MKYWLLILFIACNAFAANYGVLGLCSKARGVEHCTLVSGDYRSMSVGDAMVVAAGFDLTRYEFTDAEHEIVNTAGTKVRVRDAFDDRGYKFMVFESRDNLWITDPDGCFMMKYLAGSPDSFRSRYAFTELKDPMSLVGVINECRTKKDTK